MVFPLMRSTLRQFQKEKKGFIDPLARKIFTMISSAVAYCHQQGIMHGDLKPDNILVDYDDELNLTKLCIADFGQATDSKLYRARMD